MVLWSTVYITKSMVEFLWKCVTWTANQEIPCLSRNGVWKTPSLYPILSLLNPIHTFTTYYFLRSILMLSSHLFLGLASDPFLRVLPLLFRVNIQSFSHTCYMSRPSHPPSYKPTNDIIWSVQIMKFMSMQFSVASFYLISVRSWIFSWALFLKYSQSLFFPWIVKLSFIHMQDNRKVLYINWII